MPTITIPDKICEHCGGNRWSVENRKKPTKAEPDKRVIRYRCAVKAVERRKIWSLTHPGYDEAYFKTRDVKRRADGYWRTPKMQAYFREREQHYRDTLTDKYIRYLWRKNPDHKHHTLTEEELHIYRTYLITSRQLKQLENGKKESNNRH